MNQTPVVVATVACGMSYPLGIAPPTTMERCSRRW